MALGSCFTGLSGLTSEALASGLATAAFTAAFTAAGGRTGFEAALATKGGAQAAREAAQSYWKNLLLNVPKHALAEIPKELPDELFSQISSALATNPKADIGHVVGDFIQRSPELMGAIALMGGAGGAMGAQQQGRGSQAQAETHGDATPGGDAQQRGSSGSKIPENTTNDDAVVASTDKAPQTSAEASQQAQAPAAKPSRPPLDAESSRKLITNVEEIQKHRPLSPVEQADLEQARKVVAGDTARKASPSTRPQDVAKSQALIENVSKMPPEAQQHPQVEADRSQAEQVLQEHVQKLESQKEPLSEAQKKELADAKTTLERLASERSNVRLQEVTKNGASGDSAHHDESLAIESDFDTFRDDWTGPTQSDVLPPSFNADAISTDQNTKRSSFDPETGELQYKADYYKKVGRQKDNLDVMIANLEKQGVKVTEDGEGASYSPIEANGKIIGHQITHGPITKKWELLEEYAHHRVELGWKKKEIEELTNQLKKGRRKPFGGWHKIRDPGRVAEEIIVKQHLLDHASSLGEPERERLRETIKQLYNHGLEDGY